MTLSGVVMPVGAFGRHMARDLISSEQTDLTAGGVGADVDLRCRPNQSRAPPVPPVTNLTHRRHSSHRKVVTR
jgi:hypothetical protein